MANDFEQLLSVYLDRANKEPATDRRGTDAIGTILHQFFDRSPEGMYISTVHGHFTAVNPAFARLLGYTPVEMRALPVQEIYSLQAERRRFRGTIEAAGRVHNFRVVLRTKAQEELPALVDAIVYHGPDGGIAGYVGTVRLEHRTVSIRRDLDQFELALRGGSEGLWTWHIEGNEARFSGRFKELLGYEEHEFHNSMQEWTSRIHPDDLQKFRDALTAHIRRKRPHFASYFRMAHRDGEYRWMMARGRAEFDTRGKAIRIGGSLTNVSAHIHMIEQLKAGYRRLEDQKQQLEVQRDLLYRYLPEELRSQVQEKGEERISPRNDDAAVLVVGIGEIDYYHSRLSPGRFVTFMNELVADISDFIHGHGGIVARVEGDLIVATFGMIVRTGDDVDHCFRAAGAIGRYLETYNDVRDPGLTREVSVTMGVSYGRIFSGTTGGSMRLDFTVFGSVIRRAQLLQARCNGSGELLLADHAAASWTTGAVTLHAVSSPPVEDQNGPEKLYGLTSVQDPDGGNLSILPDLNPT